MAQLNSTCDFHLTRNNAETGSMREHSARHRARMLLPAQSRFSFQCALSGEKSQLSDSKISPDAQSDRARPAPAHSDSGTYSKMSPGWHSRTLQSIVNVENRTALTFPVFIRDKLTFVMPTCSASSLRDILRSAITRSSLKTIGMTITTTYQLNERSI